MNFDTSTLMIATSLTTALSAVVLLGMWAQHRRATALLWWFVANVLAAIGIAVLAIGLSEKNIHLTVAGTTLNGIALPLLWIGIRVFNRTPTSLPLVLLAVFGWVAADLAAGFMQFTSAFSFAGWCAWLLASAFELWRGRAERIPARWPLLAVFVLHASVCAGGVYDDLAGNMPRDALAPLDSWFGAIFFEGIVFAMASAVLMAMLCNERETQEYMRAARRDSLTGIANHGALLETSRRIYERCRRDGVPVSVIMFDLDHFKSINDAHGHRVGDDVLRAFVDTVRGLLRPTYLFGRYGGEEFTVILPGSTIETAQVIAERVRHAFAETHRFLNGQPLSATVSAGVAEAGADMTLDDTVDAADQAMYQAKKLGRNRVARAERQSPADGRDSIVRIA